MILKLVTTSDGSHTIYVPELDEHYHSVHGAVQESRHVFIGAGYMFCEADPLRIYEAGFGTGLNALLTATESTKLKRNTFYTSIEKYPLAPEILGTINHGNVLGNDAAALYSKIHEAPWGKMTAITSHFSIEKINGDLISDTLTGEYDLIYFDAFGPGKQPAIWSLEVFQKISALAAPRSVFVTYSSRGAVKRNLRECGFVVELLPGPPGKRQIIRAVKI